MRLDARSHLFALMEIRKPGNHNNILLYLLVKNTMLCFQTTFFWLLLLLDKCAPGYTQTKKNKLFDMKILFFVCRYIRACQSRTIAKCHETIWANSLSCFMIWFWMIVMKNGPLAIIQFHSWTSSVKNTNPLAVIILIFDVHIVPHEYFIAINSNHKHLSAVKVTRFDWFTFDSLN